MSKKRRKGSENVELNLAAMLDMAFQLLTFFILTFKPAPVEGQVDLRLPPPEPVTNVAAKAQAGKDDANKDPVQGLESLIVSIFPTPGGQIGSLAIGESNVAGLGQLEAQLKTILADPGSPFKQVIIQVGAALRYEELMRVIDICTRQSMADGSKLSKLSFVELPEAGGN
jgi:biopolymer transport protein ExbD